MQSKTEKGRYLNLFRTKSSFTFKTPYAILLGLYNSAFAGRIWLFRIARIKRHPVKTDLARSVLGLGCKAPPGVAFCFRDIRVWY